MPTWVVSLCIEVGQRRSTCPHAGRGKHMRRVRLTAFGHGQGGFFRAATGDEARRLGLTGWVRNLEGGSVEAEAQGPAEEVDALVEFCRKGPGHATVTE